MGNEDREGGDGDGVDHHHRGHVEGARDGAPSQGKDRAQDEHDGCHGCDVVVEGAEGEPEGAEERARPYEEEDEGGQDPDGDAEAGGAALLPGEGGKGSPDREHGDGEDGDAGELDGLRGEHEGILNGASSGAQADGEEAAERPEEGAEGEHHVGSRGAGLAGAAEGEDEQEDGDEEAGGEGDQVAGVEGTSGYGDDVQGIVQDSGAGLGSSIGLG